MKLRPNEGVLFRNSKRTYLLPLCLRPAVRLEDRTYPRRGPFRTVQAITSCSLAGRMELRSIFCVGRFVRLCY